MRLYAYLVLTLLVGCEIHEVLAKRGGGGSRGGSSRGGSSSRGNSASRGNSGSRGTSSGKKTGGGWFGGSSKKASKGFGGASRGSKLSSGNIKKALAGAAAGYFAYKGGKFLLKNAARGYMAVNGMNYYHNQGMYRQSGYRSGQQQCSSQVGNDPNFNNHWIDQNNRVTVMYFSCQRGQYCCGMECCNSGGGGGGSWWIILVVLVVIGLFVCCGAVILYKFFRKSLDCLFPSSNRDENKMDDIPMQNDAQQRQPFIQATAPNYPNYSEQQNYGGNYATQAPTTYPSYPSQPQQAAPPPYGFQSR